jgi:hypothetical protein
MNALPVPYRPVAGMLIPLLALNGCAAYRLTGHERRPFAPEHESRRMVK